MTESKNKTKAKSLQHVIKKIPKAQLEAICKDPVRYSYEVKVDELVEFLKVANYHYYRKEPIIEDSTYDLMMELLKERDPSNDFLSGVGISDDKNEVTLPYAMPSLDKVTELNDVQKELKSWTKKYDGPYVISDKLDGVSAQLIKHDNGKVKLYTRGNGTKGQDISHLIEHLVTKQQIKNLTPGMSLRGEIVMPKKSLGKLKQEYKNGRSSISGLVGAKKSKYNHDTADHAHLVIYSMIYPHDMRHLKTMQKIKKMGFKTVWYKCIKVENKDELDIEELEENFRKTLKKRREKSPYDIDGIVCVDSSKEYKVVNKNPKHAFAFKIQFEDQIAEVKVTDVVWQPSMYGYLNPKVIFNETIVNGVKIKRATAHNAKYIKDNKIGKGSKIKIIRSGDVIPYILKVIRHAKKPSMPKMKYKWTKSKVDIIVTNASSEIHKQIKVRQINHFFSKLKVKHISSATISKLYEKGFTDVFKIINGSQKKMAKIDGLGTKSVEKIFSGISRSMKTVKLNVLMAASLKFGRNFGSRRLKLITNSIPNILTITITKKDLTNKIKEINGFSDITATQFSDNLGDFIKFFKKLEKCVDISHIRKNVKSKSRTASGSDFTGQTVVFTGFRDDDLKNKIEDQCGKVTTSVSKNTTILIYVHDPTKPKPSKLLKAQQLFEKTGKPMLMKKDQFIKKYGM